MAPVQSLTLPEVIVYLLKTFSVLQDEEDEEDEEAAVNNKVDQSCCGNAKNKQKKHMDPRTLPAVVGIKRILSATFGCAGKILLAAQEREEVGFLHDIDLQMQTWWLGCVYIRSDHNASSTTSGPGHADRITFQSGACLYGQHPDTGPMLIPNVNAA